MIMLVWVLFFGAVVADLDCVDQDRYVVDSNDHKCNYYDSKPDQCGRYDTNDFKAADICCSCEGYAPERHTVPPRPTRPPPAREARTSAPPREEETPPQRTVGCFAFDEPEMDRANCDYKNKNNCPDFQPGSENRCRFTCKEGYYPPGGDAEQLFMTCDRDGKWHANAKCVTQNESPEDRRTGPARTTGTPPTRVETQQITLEDSGTANRPALRSAEPTSSSIDAITTNITVVNGDAACSSTTWKSPKDYIQCATKPGVFMAEIIGALAVALLLIIGLIVGIVCCVCRSRKDSAFSGTQSLQLKSYDWTSNPERFDKL